MAVGLMMELPTHRVEAPEEFVTAAAIAEIAGAAESAGYTGVYVTDHPAPDAKWLDHGGHHALDPFVALSFAAAATTSLSLLTNIYIAAYRNPFLSAKQVQSLSVLSGHRFILGVGAGYLKAEFRALGVDFDTRGALLDESLEVLRAVLGGEDIAWEGSSFSARGVRLRPALPPATPPIWVGGNSKAAIRRAVTRHEGWSPFNTFGYSATTRTAEVSDLAELEAAIGWARSYADEIGRTAPLDVCFSAGPILSGRRSADERRSVLERLEQIGVTHVTVDSRGDDRAEVIGNLREFAADVVPA